MQSDVIEIKIRAVVPTPRSGWGVFLGNEEKVFVFYVDPYVGGVLSMVATGETTPRPRIHDLFGALMEGFGSQLQRAVINDFDAGTYFARLIIKAENELGTKLVELDARPSDAIALAYMHRVPLYIARKVFSQVEDVREMMEEWFPNQGEEEDAAGGQPEED